VTRRARAARRPARSRRTARAIPAHAILFPGNAEDRLGVHLMECRAYDLAERCFRDAISLNPAEPHFKVHLAHSLYQQRRCREAVDILHQVLRAVPEFPPAMRLLEWCTGRLADLPEQHDTKGGTGATGG
jgi:predicted Zn-dependent protease